MRGRAWPASTTRCASRRRVARRPSSAAARWSWAARPGAARAARRTSTESTGLAFCGIVEDPPRPSTAGSASSPISGRASSSTSLAMWPQRVGGPDQRVGVPGERGAAGVPRGARGRGRACGPSSATRNCAASASPASSTDARPACRRHRRPAAGSAGPRRSSRASSTPWSHWAALSPKVIGTACWVSVRPAITSSRCRSARRASAVDLRVELREHAGRRRRAAHSTSAVSSTSWLVRPRCSQRAASGLVSREPLAQQRRAAGRRGCRWPRRRSASCVEVAPARRAGAGRPAAVGGRDPAVDERVRARPPRPRTRRAEHASRVRRGLPARSSPGQSRSAIRTPGRRGRRSRRRPAAGRRSA